MPIVFIPALLRELTGGQTRVQVPGATVREVIENLEARYPGMHERLVEESRLRPNITVVVDGVPGAKRLRTPVGEDSEVHFIPSMSGGCRSDLSPY